MQNAPVLTLLTDYGTADHYVAAVKGVILGISPGVTLVDVTHEVTAFSVPEAAFTLSQSWKCFPVGTVHLAVVDPGVGSERRALVAAQDGHFFVAPDNGLLGMVLGAGAEVREITAGEYFRQPVSRTFHGRDIFGPVAGHLANGVALEKFGPRVEDWLRPEFAMPVPLGPGCWRGTVLKVDHFGNLITNFAAAQYPLEDGKFELQVGNTKISRRYAQFSAAPAGELFVYRGSMDFLEVSLNQGDAAALLRVGAGASMELRSAFRY